MEYLTLLSRLEKKGFTAQQYGCLKNRPDLLKLRMLQAGQSHYDASVLYLCGSASLPACDLPGQFVVFCCGFSHDFSVYQSSSFTICHFGAHTSAGELFNAVMDLLAEVSDITAGMHILVNALISGNGLQYLVDSATQLLGNPIYVIDLQNKYLAISAGIIPPNDFLREENETGYVSEESFSAIRRNRLDEKIRACGSAFYYYSTVAGQGMLVDTLTIQDIEVGHIMMMETQQPFREFDADFFHRFGKLVSMELQKDSAYAHNKGVMFSYFLGDLIKDSRHNARDARNRMKALGRSFYDTFYILAIPPSDQGMTELKFELILEKLRDIFVGSIYVIYEDTIVFLISKPLDEGLSEYELVSLRDYLSANNLKAGISNFFLKLENTTRAYRQAVDSVHLGRKLQDDAPIYFYSDYYLYQIVEHYEKQDPELRFLIHPGLMKLYLYDREHGTDFIDTLIAYLASPGHPTEVAGKLHVHKNTLLYRMGKIKEITRCEFVQGEDFMNFNLSIRIMKYLHMI